MENVPVDPLTLSDEAFDAWLDGLSAGIKLVNADRTNNTQEKEEA